MNVTIGATLNLTIPGSAAQVQPTVPVVNGITYAQAATNAPNPGAPAVTPRPQFSAEVLDANP